jgi:curli production assembly/transport component CsgG
MRYSYSYATLFYYFWLWSLYNQPTGIEKKAFIGESTPATLLKDLPKKEPIVVGLYKFRDQTGAV